MALEETNVRLEGADNQTTEGKNHELAKAFNSFLHNETTGGVILLICAIIAVILATIPSCSWFDKFWETHASITAGKFYIGMSLREWVNDALMAIFFFYVGLEIKREMLVGHLSSVKKASLPILAALGGMLVPAIIFSIFNHNNPDMAHGWGIPMATDIAFALGVLSILGKRVPPTIKIFLTALAIADDLGAIIVLAIFYPTHALHWNFFLYAIAILATLYIFNKLHVRNKYAYLIPGVIVWYFVYRSGIHATIAGVLLAVVIPHRGTINELKFQSTIQYLLNKFKKTSNSQIEVLASPEQQYIIHDMEEEIHKIDPLMHLFESNLHTVVTFFIMPLFALANAGVAFNLGQFAEGIPTVSLGIFFGLLVGKPVGIFLFSFLGIKCKLAQKPEGIKWIQLAAAGVLGGIGFTMSIFVNGLSFHDAWITDMGKISILLTSTTAALLGLIAVAYTCREKAPETPSKDNYIKENV